MKTIAVVTLTAVLTVGALAAPAWAKETGWGCGGACKQVHGPKHAGR